MCVITNHIDSCGHHHNPGKTTEKCDLASNRQPCTIGQRDQHYTGKCRHCLSNLCLYTDCGQRLETSAELLRHMKRDHNLNGWCCWHDECRTQKRKNGPLTPKVFRYPAGLKRHLKDAHGVIAGEVPGGTAVVEEREDNEEEPQTESGENAEMEEDDGGQLDEDITPLGEETDDPATREDAGEGELGEGTSTMAEVIVDPTADAASQSIETGRSLFNQWMMGSGEITTPQIWDAIDPVAEYTAQAPIFEDHFFNESMIEYGVDTDPRAESFVDAGAQHTTQPTMMDEYVGQSPADSFTGTMNRVAEIGAQGTIRSAETPEYFGQDLHPMESFTTFAAQYTGIDEERLLQPTYTGGIAEPGYMIGTEPFVQNIIEDSAQFREEATETSAPVLRGDPYMGHSGLAPDDDFRVNF